MDPNAQLPPDYFTANRFNDVFIPATVTFAIATTCVCLRFIAGWISKRPLWYDDYFAGITGLTVKKACGVAIYSVVGTWRGMGFGRHIGAAMIIHPTVIKDFMTSIFVLELLYTTAISTAKLSIIAFLWRIFGKTSMRYILVGLLCFTLSWFIAILFTSIFSCVPVNAFWDITITDKRCIDTYKFYVGITFPNMLCDFIITLVPAPYVWNLQVSLKQKLLITFTLFFGGFTSIISAVRLANIFNNFSLADPTWDSVTLMKWTAVEVFCAITSVCLPTFRPLLRWATGHSLATAAEASRPSRSGGSKNFFQRSSQKSKKYHSADQSTDTDSQAAITTADAVKSPDGFSVQTYPMNAIEVRRDYECLPPHDH
ncbi:uncharacterized protein BDR25DRAFT_319620 [Lindgomyces ingoldianus]|uniref:Uncharacterized protein n=1 Tax=Lindgomyces ingoldianus TaxID=673940 RepID=A0ACB6QAA1_9PLEO|nr:uncharacterized protein BDR25DRAFT_319620 [Lindgomyces ingoldianus]KAF2463888.1 hypothetical protein BDR25DRAFT_319620 [Lindgomyces ingoldianus]